MRARLGILFAGLQVELREVTLKNKPFEAHGAIFRLNRVASQKHTMDRVPQNVLSRDPTIPEFIFEGILKRRK